MTLGQSQSRAPIPLTDFLALLSTRFQLCKVIGLHTNNYVLKLHDCTTAQMSQVIRGFFHPVHYIALADFLQTFS
jgi:hypothetical protein